MQMPLFIRSMTLCSLLMLISSPLFANELGRTIAQQGNNKGATACISCHGAAGQGMAAAGFPLLAGIDAGYLEKQLVDFTTDKRANAIMTSIARSLTAKEKKAVAEYFAKQSSPKSSPATQADAARLKLGKAIAEQGNWPNNVPACFACHGVDAAGIGKHFPLLAGQHALYIEQQLGAWRNGTRSNDPNELMKGVAMRLSDAEIKAVSTYLSSLSAINN